MVVHCFKRSDINGPKAQSLLRSLNEQDRGILERGFEDLRAGGYTLEVTVDDSQSMLTQKIVLRPDLTDHRNR